MNGRGTRKKGETEKKGKWGEGGVCVILGTRYGIGRDERGEGARGGRRQRS